MVRRSGGRLGRIVALGCRFKSSGSGCWKGCLWLVLLAFKFVVLLLVQFFSGFEVRVRAPTKPEPEPAPQNQKDSNQQHHKLEPAEPASGTPSSNRPRRLDRHLQAAVRRPKRPPLLLQPRTSKTQRMLTTTPTPESSTPKPEDVTRETQKT